MERIFNETFKLNRTSFIRCGGHKRSCIRKIYQIMHPKKKSGKYFGNFQEFDRIIWKYVDSFYKNEQMYVVIEVKVHGKAQVNVGAKDRNWECCETLRWDNFSEISKRLKSIENNSADYMMNLSLFVWNATSSLLRTFFKFFGIFSSDE